MSEDALANYIDAREKDGSAATPPVDEETRGLVGTVMLAQAGLGTPPPSEEAERQSREMLVQQIQEGKVPDIANQGRDESLLDVVKRWWNRNR